MPFYYGGCEGNTNRFDSLDDCQRSCPSEFLQNDVCQMPQEVGPCRDFLERYFFDVASGTCKQFYFGGCEGNKNNFKTMQVSGRKRLRNCSLFDLASFANPRSARAAAPRTTASRSRRTSSLSSASLPATAELGRRSRSGGSTTQSRAFASSSTTRAGRETETGSSPDR